MIWAHIGFWILAAISVASAIGMVAARNPIWSGVSLVVTFIAQAVLYLTLSAQFIAAVQVIVYAGAIMVLFLFVIMLLNIAAPEALQERGGLMRPVAVLLGAAFLGIIAGAGSLSVGMGRPLASKAFIEQGGTVSSVGFALFDPTLPWLFPFEVTSFLLLVGVVGAVILAKRRV